jgi:hypothetical protein
LLRRGIAVAVRSSITRAVSGESMREATPKHKARMGNANVYDKTAFH